ncbi:MAG: hypothetical protein HN353_12090 [Bdellovibrionales bacterium]|nr:hypothetical protein [Bdellovibrionales bacterium]MBT3526164.1 hypothetical protein [Bdellovibrionales bacterium]MBT7669239.1 hypothetical protein [Bdellovibrionales bacterium]MBT7766424.1 hypothetical protein [Bdellovibrionales bacterium]
MSKIKVATAKAKKGEEPCKPATIEELVLSTEHIIGLDLSEDQVLSVKTKDQTIGPIPKSELKAALESGSIVLPNNTQIKSTDTNGWMPLYEHPLFQRRKPAIISFKTLGDSDQVHLLKHALGSQVFTKKEILDQIKEKKILLTDQISLDQGNSWCKIYQVNDFDRRILTASKLPESCPSDVILYAETSPSNQKDRIDQRDTLPSLHYIGQLAGGGLGHKTVPTPLNRHNQADGGEQLEHKDDEDERARVEDTPLINPTHDDNYTPEYQSQRLLDTIRSKKIKIVAAVVAILLSLLIIQMLGDTPNTWQQEWSVPSKAKVQGTPTRKIVKKNKAAQIKPTKPTVRRVKRTTASTRAQREEARQRRIADSISRRRERLRKNRQSANLKKERALKRRQESLANQVTPEETNRDENYDDGSTPVEQDEIRSRLSKDTIDPEEEFDAEGDIRADGEEEIGIDELSAEYELGEESSKDEIF